VRKGMHIGYWWESPKERGHWEDQGVGVSTLLKWILDRMGWYELDRSYSGQRQVKGSCEHGDDSSGTIKCWGIWLLLKKGSAL
jgi:hypothetical protein